MTSIEKKIQHKGWSNNKYRDVKRQINRFITKEEMDNQTNNAAKEMPKYKCHKEVWALKIKSIEGINQDPITRVIIVPADEGHSAFPVSLDYFHKHQPKAGGYYIQYKDGYESFSPAEAFEEGYTRMQ